MVDVIVNPSRLEQYGLRIDELVRAVRVNNLLIPAGELDAAQGRFGIKIPALIETAEDIRALPVRNNAEGSISWQTGRPLVTQAQWKESTQLFEPFTSRAVKSVSIP